MEENRIIEPREIKRIQLSILKTVIDYCCANNLQYFLAYGTLIGAVRHKGYIPWDDDVDIIMPRKDYEFLMRHFNTRQDHVRVVCPSNNKEYFTPFGKAYDDRTSLHEILVKKNVYGVYIDIFPLDGIKCTCSIRIESFLDRLVHAKKAELQSNRPLGKKLLIFWGKIVLSFINVHTILMLMERIAQLTSYDSANKVVSIYSPYAIREVVDKSLYDSYLECEFEGLRCRIPVNYDKLLRGIYGDYMTLPPLEKRIAHHEFIAWWK